MCPFEKLLFLTVLFCENIHTEGVTTDNIVLFMKFGDVNVTAYKLYKYNTFNQYNEPYAHLWDTKEFIRSDISRYRSPLLDLWQDLKVVNVEGYFMNTHNDILASMQFNATNKTMFEWFSYPVDVNMSDTVYAMHGLYSLDFVQYRSSESREIRSGALYGGSSEGTFINVLEDKFWRLPISDPACLNGNITMPPYRQYTVQKGEECLYNCYRAGTEYAIISTTSVNSDQEQNHVCGCYKASNFPSMPKTSGGCGLPCHGDPSQFCGDELTELLVLYETELITDALDAINNLLSRIVVHIAPHSTSYIMLDNYPNITKNDMCAMLSKLNITFSLNPNVTMKVTKSNCTDFEDIFTQNDTAMVFNKLGKPYIFDRRMTRCIALENRDPNPAIVELFFHNSTVLLAPIMVITAEWENDMCQMVDITTDSEFMDMSQIDTWFGKSGEAVANITNSQYGLELGYHPFSPSPQINLAVSSKNRGQSWVKYILIETNAANVSLEMNGTCTGNNYPRSYLYFGHALSLMNTYIYNLTEGTFMCVDDIHLTLENPIGDHFFLKIGVYGIVSIGVPSDADPVFNFFDEQIIPPRNVIVYSSHRKPEAILPCMPGLDINKLSNDMPLIITLIIPKDERVDSIQVESIKIRGSDILSINLYIRRSRESSDYDMLSLENYQYNGDVLSAIFPNRRQVFALQIKHYTTSDSHVIDSVNVTACVYNDDILKGLSVNYSVSCEETTVTSPTNTTLPITTTSATTTTTTTPTTTTSLTTTSPTTTTTTSPTTTTTLTTTTSPTTTTTTTPTTTTKLTTTTSPTTTTTTTPTTTTKLTTTTSPTTTTTTTPTTTTKLTTTTSPTTTTTTTPTTTTKLTTTTSPTTTTTTTPTTTTKLTTTTSPTTSTSTIPSQATTSSEPHIATETTKNSSCCKCVPVKEPVTTAEAEEKAQRLKKELTVDKSTLSSTIRKKTSANDNRPSAKMVGSLGVILLSVSFGLVVVMDANIFLKAFKKISKWYKIKKLKTLKQLS